MIKLETANQPAPEIQKAQTKVDVSLSTWLPLLRGLGSWFYALVIGALYVSGFLILNSNLSKSGVLDIEFVNARYFLASAGFVFYLVCFYLFAGRAVIFTPKWLQRDLEKENTNGNKPFWSFVILVHSLITSIFFLCLSAALFTSIAIGSIETRSFYAVLIGAFLTQYFFDTTNLDLKFPRLSKTITIVTDLIAIYAFFVYSSTGAMFTVFVNYVLIFLFINLVLDQYKRYKINTDWMIFTGLYVIVVLFGSAISYGSTLFGQVTPRLGGARPQNVSIALSNDAKKALQPISAESASQVLLEGQLIHQTTEYTYLAVSGHTIRFRTTDVVTLVSTPELEKDYKKEQLQNSQQAQ